MKTAESIEAQEERKNKKAVRRKNNANPSPGRVEVGKRNASRLRPYHWQPNQSGNPAGRPRGDRDIAAKIARAIFTNNQEELYAAYGAAALRGNAYAFKELADRAFGKIKEQVEFEVTQYREVSEKELIERVQQLEQTLGIAKLSGGTAGVPSDSERIITPPITKAN